MLFGVSSTLPSLQLLTVLWSALLWLSTPLSQIFDCLEELIVVIMIHRVECWFVVCHLQTGDDTPVLIVLSSACYIPHK